MVVRGDTVDVDLLGKSDLGTALGIPETRHYERLVFVDGMLKAREVRRPTEEYQTYGELLVRMAREWRESQPARRDSSRSSEPNRGPEK